MLFLHPMKNGNVFIENELISLHIVLKAMCFSKRILLLTVFLFLVFFNIRAQDTVKIMYYNVLNYTTAKNQWFRTIFDYYHPDIMVLSEMNSDADAVSILNQVINRNGANNYSKAAFTDGPDSDNALFYNNEKIGLSFQDTIQTDLRLINRYHLYQLPATSDSVIFDCFGTHLKSSNGPFNEQKRYLECLAFKNYLETQTTGENILFGGDFNFYSSSEPAYTLLTTTGNFLLNDPVNRPGNWDDNAAFADVHTQSTRVRAFGGGATSGMDSRFDFILLSSGLMTQTSSVHYIPDSYYPLGNDGLHFNDSLLRLPLSATVPDSVTYALYNLSDHLPVVLKIKVNSTIATGNTLNFCGFPGNGYVATPVAAFTIEVRNAANQVNTAFSGTVTLALSEGNGTMTGTLSKQVVNGIATFNDIQFSTIGNYRIAASTVNATADTSSVIKIIPVPQPEMQELVIPRFMGCKTASSANTARTPVAFCISLNNLSPNTMYNLKAGLALVSEAATIFGAGNVWNGTFSSQTITNAFITDNQGSSGPLWIFIQPTGNGTRFDAGQVHNLRIAYYTGSVAPGSPLFVGEKTITALDIAPTARTTFANDDGAFIKGSADVSANGKYVLLFNNVSGTGDPVFAYQIRNAIPTSAIQTGLPSIINDVYMQSGTSNTGDYSAVIPIGANNPQGIRRIEARNADNTIYAYNTDDDGIWSSGANTTTIARKNVATITLADAPLIPVKTLNLKLFIEGLYNENGTMNCARNENNFQYANNIADKITVNLHDEILPYSPVFSASDVSLLSDGNATVQFPVSFSNSYYISVAQRNSITTWSATPVSMEAVTTFYDFTTAVTNAYGDNLKHAGSNFLIFSGDINQDGFVDSADMSLLGNDATNFIMGYLATDINGDGFVDSADMTIVDDNAGNFVSSITP
ncbi:MAG: hypothetical protein M0R21_03280 [Lentimicrobiaceae bacterium]|nr:hypothetical protein [Lentimicrobiaceae bacterium]